MRLDFKNEVRSPKSYVSNVRSKRELYLSISHTSIKSLFQIIVKDLVIDIITRVFKNCTTFRGRSCKQNRVSDCDHFVHIFISAHFVPISLDWFQKEFSVFKSVISNQIFRSDCKLTRPRLIDTILEAQWLHNATRKSAPLGDTFLCAGALIFLKIYAHV